MPLALAWCGAGAKESESVQRRKGHAVQEDQGGGHGGKTLPVPPPLLCVAQYLYDRALASSTTVLVPLTQGISHWQLGGDHTE